MSNIIDWNAIKKVVPKNNHFNSTDDPYSFFELSKQEQENLLMWCLIFERTNKFNHRISSYGLKHIYERNLHGSYVTNGQFKGAMLLAGFKVYDVDKKNWRFNIKMQEVESEEKRNIRQSIPIIFPEAKE
ncbi:hypothetical protein ACTQ54_03175 [Fundicoccus sp. Sow4_H7]|uniref:hypothetical protein n=1 Tax=Fundicoccus sp. Sow4_H7 TaxID=3438784 RepID=UPI003F8EB370